MERSAEKVSSSTLWQTLFAKWSISWCPMLRKKLYGCESSSTSLKWHPLLMAPSCYTTIILEPLLKQKNRDPIGAPNIFCTAITLSERSWIEVTSTFRRSTKKKIWPTHLLKLSKLKSLMTTSQRWIFDTVLIGFSPSGSCWKICTKVNR